MSIDQHAPAEPLPEKGAGAADLPDNVGDGDVGAQIVAGDRDPTPRALGPRAIWLKSAGSSERHQPP